MAACDSLQHIFEKSLPENPSLLESLSSSWKQIKPAVKPIDHSFTELFGEQETTPPPPPAQLPFSSFLSSLYSSSVSSVSTTLQNNIADDTKNNESPLIKSLSSSYNGSYGGEARHKKSDSFSAMNPESLQLCTEGLGFESSDEVEYLKKDQINSNSNNKGGGGGGGDHNSNINNKDNFYNHQNKGMENVCVDRPALAHSSRTTAGIYLCSDRYRRAKTCGRTFPPPISCIGRTGKPWVCFKSYRHDGRFVLQEVRIPTREFLRACRKDGRLRLSLVQSDEEHIGFDEREEDDLVDQEINREEDDEETREGSC